MNKVILHCDLNCFYASVEMLYKPELRKVPMAVAGDPENRHGIILTKNVLAKKAGVSTAEPIWKAKQKCPNLVLVEPDYESYMYFSKKVKDLYYEYTDRIESFGLDEAWLDITESVPLFGSVMNIVNEILRRVKEEVGLTLSIGISFNKIYAKLGSDIATEDSYFLISKPEDVFNYPASSLLMVGPHTSDKLKEYAIYTIGDIARTNLKYMKSILGKAGETLYYFAWGQDLSEVKKYTDDYELIKSIGNSTTTKRDLYDLDDLKMILTVLSDSISSRCKDQGFYFKTIHLFLRTKKLETRSLQLTLKENSDLAKDIYQSAIKLFKENCNFAVPYRSIGLSVTNLSFKKETSYISLFNDELYSLKQKKAEEALEKIRNRFGYHSVTSLRLLLDKELTTFDPKKENVISPISYFRS